MNPHLQEYPGTLVESSSSLQAMTNPFGYYIKYMMDGHLRIQLYKIVGVLLLVIIC